MPRMWQGKCFEEQSQIGRALGIYNELLDHPSQKPAFLSLRRQVLHFKLICQNIRKEYALVEISATDWMKKNRALQRTLVGLGIRYQLARAPRELRGQRRTDGRAKRRSTCGWLRLMPNSSTGSPGNTKTSPR